MHAGGKMTKRSRNAGHQEAQRLYVADKCVRCGSTKHVDRHHRDKDPTNNRPTNILILCRRCHLGEHKKPLRISHCAVCEGTIINKPRAALRKICSPFCHSVWSVRSMQKRWGRDPVDRAPARKRASDNYQARHKALGLCLYCSCRAERGLVRCRKHNLAAKARERARRTQGGL